MKKSTKAVEKKPATRAISASEIARNVKHFETWSSCQACEQVVFSDLPPELRDEVLAVFDVERKLPIRLVRECSLNGQIASLAPELASFIRKVSREAPSLFSDRDDLPLSCPTFSELNCVVAAWKQLRRMRKQKEKWSESDYANVYSVLRTPAIRESAYWTQCTISLPEHLPHIPLTASTQRVIRAKAVVPDSAIFICANTIRTLSSSKHSPYKRLSHHPSVRKHCTSETALRYQSTPRAQFPEHAAFEFASSFWEDKKPNCEYLDMAYRQNRMATTAGVRHLVSLGIRAPVFGLVFSDGTVRAHVDWCSGEGEQMTIQSAPYPGPQPISSDGISTNSTIPSTSTTPNTSACTTSSPIFHEWTLDKPSDILRVFLLIRNIDVYTAGPFRARVEEGVKAFVERMERNEEVYRPWKVPGTTAAPPRVLKTKVNVNANVSIDTSVSEDIGNSSLELEQVQARVQVQVRTQAQDDISQRALSPSPSINAQPSNHPVLPPPASQLPTNTAIPTTQTQTQLGKGRPRRTRGTLRTASGNHNENRNSSSSGRDVNVNVQTNVKAVKKGNKPESGACAGSGSKSAAAAIKPKSKLGGRKTQDARQ